MSGATPNVPVPVQLQPVEMHKALQDGEKFIKWDEDSGTGTPVTLRIDSKGFFLYWIDQNHEVDFLDIATIRDARTGQYAKLPKDPKLRQIVTMGSQDTLEEKTVTICYGADFVNLTFINFCCTKKEIAQLWTESIFRLAYNLSLINGSTIMFLQKVHTRLLLVLDKAGNLPVKNIVKFLAQHKDDRKRIEKALESTGLPCGKNDNINPSRFTFDTFYAFYKQLTQRSEVEKIFYGITGSPKNVVMTAEQVIDFLNKTQRDPRLNEILHPYVNAERAKDLVSLYEDNKNYSSKGQIAYNGFLRYLMSENNPIISSSKLEMCDDLEQPLAHYFINSSHNTYLTGHQITGKSSVEIYRQSLLAGCRCVELDFWNGRFDEPVIVHGYTFVQVISAKDVLEAIAESAFKTSDLPVVLSFENHCNPRQQAKIANYCREIFGEMLLEKPLESHPLESGGELPPPSLLRRKIIIKNKKKHHHHHHHHKKVVGESVGEEGGVPITQGNGDIGAPHTTHQLQRQSSKDSSGSSDIDSSSEDEGGMGGDASGAGGECGPTVGAVGDKAQQAKETEAGAEISALVNYVQPVHFSSFENSEKKNRFYEMSSFDEKQATTLLKERPIEFVNYNKHQLSRVYPAGTRFDSSNFMPQVFWNAGCQLVALNYQTLDLAMQLNLGIYEYNMRSGFLLKPEFMRRKDRRLDPFTESTVDGIIAGTVSITVLSGQFLSDRRVSTFVEVEMYGLPADTVRKKFRTKIVPNNGINPIYGDEPFVFKKVVLPELASLRLAVYDDSGKLLGHRVLPVVGLCHGYRHVQLRNELNQPLLTGTLFLHIIVKDYVPDGLSDLAEALANPIKYQSEREKREIQLAVLTEDMEAEASEDQFSGTLKSESGTASKGGSKGWSPRHRASVGGLPPQAPPSVGPAPACSSPNISGETHTATSPGQQNLLNISDGDTDLAITQDEQTCLEQSVNSIALGDTSDIEVESVEKILSCKAVKEKRQELEKKLETLKRKHEKERLRQQSALQKSCDLSGGPGAEQRRKFYMTKGLVKRLSSKNMENSSVDVMNSPNVSSVPEGEASSSTNGATDSLQALLKEHATQVQDLRERYIQTIYAQADKYLKQSQQAQHKLLRALLERETAQVMRQLQHDRREEVKALAKKHKDRDELVRIKREVASQMVERGVTERVRLTKMYDKRKEILTKQHEKVKQQLQDQKDKELNSLVKEFELPSNTPDKEQPPSVSESHN